jgi:hypothetical protein
MLLLSTPLYVLLRPYSYSFFPSNYLSTYFKITVFIIKVIWQIDEIYVSDFDVRFYCFMIRDEAE